MHDVRHSAQTSTAVSTKPKQLRRSPAAKTNNNELTAVTLFAGAGGLHLGLERAGFKILASSDFSAHAESTHALNWPRIPFLKKDARLLTTEDILNATGGIRPDLIAGGPPCQGFSTLGDKISADPRNNLFKEFVRLVRDLQPRFVLMENVRSLVTMYNGRFRDLILREFSQLGYSTNFAVLDAANYGVPQFRQRVFFFCTKHTAPFAYPEPTHGPEKKPYITVGDALGGLDDRAKLPNHILLSHSEKVIARYKLIPEGGKLPPPEKLPKAIRRNNFGNTYKRLDRKKPSLTMVPGNNAFPIHPTRHRSLSPREAARLQSFPDDFVFAGDRRNQCILVGNAVPPLLAESIGTQIVRHAYSKEVRDTNSNTPIPARENERKSTKRKGFRFVDLFCGAGGFTIGFHRACWNPVLCVDNNPNVVETHAHNHPEIPFLPINLSQAGAMQEITKACGRSRVDLVVGGPPCQGFSIFGKRRFVNTRGYRPHDDPRNALVFAFITAVKLLKPRWFVMENVPGFASLDQGRFLETILKEFRQLGYKNAQARILNAADYGVPQLRKRLLIIGNTTGHIIPWPKKKFFQDPKDWQDSHTTVGEAIGDLADDQAHRHHTCHVAMKHKPKLVERYRLIPEGGKLDPLTLPARLRKGYRTSEVKNFSHVHKRLHRSKPANTMVPGHNAFPIHPWLDRALTVREAARIQTFPDELEFKGSRQEQCIQVGNAFPPLLAEVLAANIMKAEKNNWFPGRVPRSALYALVDSDPSQSEET